MPQLELPIFPASSTAITNELAFEQRDGTVYYFNGHLPVFSHPADDLASFRFCTSQPFCCVTKPIDPGLQRTLEEQILPAS